MKQKFVVEDISRASSAVFALDEVFEIRERENKNEIISAEEVLEWLDFFRNYDPDDGKIKIKDGKLIFKCTSCYCCPYVKFYEHLILKPVE